MPSVLPATEPDYRDLPTLPHSGLRHAWEVWKESSPHRGTVNRTRVVGARSGSTAVETGRRIALSLPLDQPDPPLFGRRPLIHVIERIGRNILDDRLDNVFPQASSQWDGLRHIRLGDDGFFEGHSSEDLADPEVLGIQHWSEGIIGRGVLIDVAPILAAEGIADPFQPYAITAADVDRCLRAQDIELRYGDILCLATGWMTEYLAKDAHGRRAYAELLEAPAHRTWPGLSHDESTAEFLWDRGVAAVAADNPGVEVAEGIVGPPHLHRRLIGALGFALGELFDFTQLREHCRATGRWDFMFLSVPLAVPGGVGSPANAVAVV